MKDFDLNTIGKEMPYKAPSKDFFEDFTTEIMTKVEKPRKIEFTWFKDAFTPIWGVAAALAVIFILSLELSNSAPWSTEYIISDNLDESFDSFFNNLSDEDLEYLAAESSYNEEFYYNLPND